MVTRLPNDLPRLLAAVAGLSFLAWGFASIWSEAAIGRPSSTAGLAYVFIPIWAGIFSAGGFIVGFVLRALVPRPDPNPSTPLRGLALAILLVAPVSAATWGYQGVRRVEAEARPRVLVSSAQVIRDVVVSRSPVDSRAGVLIWEHSGGADRGSATDDLPTVCFDGSSATFVFDGRRSAPLGLQALNYVTSAYLLPLGDGGSTRGYVAVINGRATGRRSVVAVLSPDLRVLHAELVARWWQLDHNPLWAEPGSDPSFEVARVGSMGDQAITFRLNEPQDK